MKRNLIRIQQFLLNPKSACRNVLNLPLTGVNLLATKPLTVQIPPATGIISTPTGFLQSENLHPLEENTRVQVSKRPKTSSHWRNWYVGRFTSTKSIHSLEQSSRPRASQRNKTPSGWSDPPADRHLSVQKTPMGGGRQPARIRKKPLPGTPRGARPEDPDPANRNKSLPRAAGSEHQKANKKGGSRSRSPTGTPCE